MSRRLYTPEEAYQILTQSNESSGEFSPPQYSSDSDSDLQYEPPKSSTSESEEEVVRPKRRRSELQAATSSAEHPNGQSANANGDRPHEERPSISAARPQEERPSTSSGIPRRGRRAQTHLPDALANPLWLPSSTGSATIPPFTEQPGVQANTEGFSEIDFLNLFFPDEFLQSILDQTNLFARHYIQNNPNSCYARPFEWRPLTMEELRLFLGLILNMGLTKKNELHSYWSKKPIIHMPIFSAVMSRSRFDMIMRFLHFSDNSQCPPRNHPDFDKLFKIRPLIDFFNKRFAELYIPEQNISVDESLVHFTGRLGIKQYIPSKRARYGLKLNKLCESSSGYVNAFRVYEGKDSQLQPPECPSYMGISGKIVWELAFPLLQKGYHIYMDNYYTSLPLFRHLFLKDTLACGTSRKNRKGFPQSLVTTRLQKGESASLRNEEVLAVKWRDKKDVYIMSTIHNDTSVELHRRRGTVQKPCCINEYNKFMGGVDLNDQMLQPYLSTRKSLFWYKKVAIYFFHMALYNAYVTYQKSTEMPSPFIRFIENVVTALIYQQGSAPQSIRSDCVSRLHERHFLDHIPPSATGRRRQKKCRVCSKSGIRKDTSYHCPDCPSQPGLCIGKCYKRYHTHQNY